MSHPARISMRIRLRLLAGLAMGTSLFAGHRQAVAAEAPDIIVMLLNDARDGDQIALQQTMEHLRDRGTTFPNFFLTTPLCCPSRATILTGLYSHNTGVYENSDGQNGGWLGFARRNNRGRSTGVLLQNAGYRTVALGNYLNGNPPGRGVEPGWHVTPRANRRSGQQIGQEGKDNRRGKKKNDKQRGPRGGMSDRQCTDAAIAELAGTPIDQPLYLHIGFGAPHVPVNPVPPYAGQFAGAQIDRAHVSFNEADMGDKPRYMRSLSRLTGSEEAWLDGLHVRRLECLLELDDNIARLWDAIAARGKLANTYVFLLTDNGYLLGHHRFYGKHVPYDGSARMPLYAFGPGFAAGDVDERLIGNIDIAPTLAEVAGVTPPVMDGVSLLSSHDRDAIALEFLARNVNSMKWPGPRTAISRYGALRTARHLYVEHRTGERELYDYQEDPHETQNLLTGNPPPAVLALAADLASRLDELRGCRGASCL